MFHFQVGHKKTSVSRRPVVIAVSVVVGGVIALISIGLIVILFRAKNCRTQEDTGNEGPESHSHDRAQDDSNHSSLPMAIVGPESLRHDRTQDDSGHSDLPMSNVGPESPTHDRTQDDSEHSDLPMSNVGPESPTHDRTQDDSGHSDMPMTNGGPESPSHGGTQIFTINNPAYRTVSPADSFI